MTDSESAASPLQPDLTVTADDVAALNAATVLRAAALARIAGAILVGIGILAASGWLWATVRDQQTANERYGGGGGFGDVDSESVDLVERIDILVTNLPVLVFASLAVGGGLGLRVLADYSVARSGGSLTGYEPGDSLDEVVIEDTVIDDPAGNDVS